jgi:hypothetical protein
MEPGGTVAGALQQTRHTCTCGHALVHAADHNLCHSMWSRTILPGPPRRLGPTSVHRQRSKHCSLCHYVPTDCAEAAAWAARLLGNDRDGWERLIFAFGQHKQLPILGPHVPTSHPVLSRTLYLMVATSFLSQHDQHGRLLELLHSWPHEITANIIDDVIAAINVHLRRYSKQPADNLLRTLALLHRLQVWTLALAVWLQVACFHALAAHGGVPQSGCIARVRHAHGSR